jgi:hypothetical protein
MPTRIALNRFELANQIYVGCTVTAWEADIDGVKTATKATLYEAPTGSGTLSNPQALDSEGKLERPCYVDTPVILEVSGLHVATHDTGLISPPGNWRGDWATGTVYWPGDLFRDGINSVGTKDVYIAVNLHLSGIWAVDSVDPAVMAKVIDYVDLADEVVPDATTTVKGKVELAVAAELNANDASRAVTADAFKDSKFSPLGRHLIPILAGACQAATTNGAAPATIESATNKTLYRALDFNQSTQQYAGFALPMPKSWNEGTISFRVRWTAASGSGAVIWGLQAVATSDNDALDVAYGTAQEVTDTLLATGRQHTSPESAAITIAGSPAEGDLVLFRIYRKAADAGDTLNADARLIAIELFVTTDTGNDA